MLWTKWNLGSKICVFNKIGPNPHCFLHVWAGKVRWQTSKTNGESGKQQTITKNNKQKQMKPHYEAWEVRAPDLCVSYTHTGHPPFHKGGPRSHQWSPPVVLVSCTQGSTWAALVSCTQGAAPLVSCTQGLPLCLAHKGLPTPPSTLCLTHKVEGETSPWLARSHAS